LAGDLEFARKRRCVSPEDVAVVGFLNDIPAARMSAPRLTRFINPLRKKGGGAVAVLLKEKGR